ncbi:hypothetical protein M406DRAFT_295837 [Cryphonectria parasitica EP155]|uniref:Cell wall biogenesis protein Mhp1 n=1 Tax=Cryphonectria parasitica (strain ATCC 38755 / EP155) TaxID=660469 RepID=A0A9P4XT91_CRYP1|nr:uncharacterized protein M406DRAFT_295837 [Cryphonectria parasitica EP155]KAF3760493.1 hypothetical protein M406DRAFT_295837 [Cryphonectria parasitica EP155]
MEQIHGIDVSWMTHNGGPKVSSSLLDHSSPRGSPTPSSPAPTPSENGAAGPDTPKSNGTVAQPPKPIPIPPKPGFTRGGSDRTEKNGTSTSPGSSPSLSRKPSWFTSLSSKFSGSAGATAIPQSPPPATTTNLPTKDAELSVPKITPAKNAVLQHAAKHQGEGPYTPAPPRSGQSGGGILHVFRRLSSSSSGQLGPAVRAANNHGLVERKILNVDHHRERCPLEDLHQAKLRRVAFCVDVEIAPMPRYAEGKGLLSKTFCGDDKTEKRKLVEKGEGEALKHPKANGSNTKKKEKKKRSEEERKARKEKKRKLAEANGQVPLELYLDTDTSDPSAPTTPRPQATPTTNPVRIYRRCCQLRETPILKKITEQLLNPANTTSAGVVEKLDLTGYWMQLADLITLGDFLAVVPAKEVVLENCGLTDEGLRVVLAGLLAAKKTSFPRKRPQSIPDGLVEQGGAIERLVLKNNKIGSEGWKHLCLFVYMCRSLVSLDLAEVPFPKSPQPPSSLNGHSQHFSLHHDDKKGPLDMCALLARSIGERLGGNTLELLNLSNTGLSHDQLGRIIDGILQCGVRRVALAHLDLNPDGLEHVGRYIASGKCEGLDLGGNDLRDYCESLGSMIEGNNTLWALSLAECNLKPASLCKLLPHLCKLSNFRFLDLSHNQELFSSEPSAVGVLRRYLPKMKTLKRLHLGDCALKGEQVIALAEVIPEMASMAHLSFLQNPELTKLADANTEETQEEASALYASLLAAARLSPNLVCVDIDVPTEASGEIVKALAKQIVAYCLRNMELVPLANGGPSIGEGLSPAGREPEYPDVLQHLVGHDIMMPDDSEDEDMAPDDDYIVGGTGVAKALACCLNNRGDESRRQSGEFIRDVEEGVTVSKSGLPAGKAKDVSKHLLLSARKIRHRLDPALVRAKAMLDKSTEERTTYYRLMFLQRTLDGIIQRFEDEFPETKETADSAISVSLLPDVHQLEKTATRTSMSSAEGEREPSAGASDGEEELEMVQTGPGSLSRQSSNLSLSSMALDREEGHALRAGHKFRSGWMLTSEQYHLLASTGLQQVEQSPTLFRTLNEMLDELGNEELLKLRDEKGPVWVFKEHRQSIIDGFKRADPDYWARFVESQEKAKANVQVSQPAKDAQSCGSGEGDGESAVVEDDDVVTAAAATAGDSPVTK